MPDKTELEKLLDEFDDESMEDVMEQYEVIQEQVEEALAKGISGGADVRIVHSILITKIVSQAISMGVSKKTFMGLVSNTWRLVKWNNEKHNEGAVH